MGESEAPVPVPPIDTNIDPRNIQGDILFDGLPKKNETFFFFRIVDAKVKDFAKSLGEVATHIAAAERTVESRKSIKLHIEQKKPGLVPMANANIAFSARGLAKVNRGCLFFADIGLNDSSSKAYFPATLEARAMLSSTLV